MRAAPAVTARATAAARGDGDDLGQLGRRVQDGPGDLGGEDRGADRQRRRWVAA